MERDHSFVKCLTEAARKSRKRQDIPVPRTMRKSSKMKLVSWTLTMSRKSAFRAVPWIMRATASWYKATQSIQRCQQTASPALRARSSSESHAFGRREARPFMRSPNTMAFDITFPRSRRHPRRPRVCQLLSPTPSWLSALASRYPQVQRVRPPLSVHRQTACPHACPKSSKSKMSCRPRKRTAFVCSSSNGKDTRTTRIPGSLKRTWQMRRKPSANSGRNCAYPSLTVKTKMRKGRAILHFLP